MALTITKILLIALYVATWAVSLPTMAGEVSGIDRESNTNTTSSSIDWPGLSGDFNVNDNAIANDNTDPSTMKFCFFDYSCCHLTESCHKLGKCFDNGHCSGPSGCDVPGLSASTTSTFTCAPTQTCGTSLITAGAPAGFLSLACFDVRTMIAEVEPGAAKMTPMPNLDSIPILEDPDLAPVSTSYADTSLLTVTQTLVDVGAYPFATITEIYVSTPSEDTPLATDISLSSAAESTGTVTLIVQDPSTSASTWRTTVQATPTNISSKSTPGARGPSRTAIVAGGLFGTVAFLAVSITSVDYLVKRWKRNRCRHSISNSSSSDNEALVHNKEEPQMTAYGYYGTNRAGTILKGSKVFEASAEPVELPAENVGQRRE